MTKVKNGYASHLVEPASKGHDIRSRAVLLLLVPAATRQLLKTHKQSGNLTSCTEPQGMVYASILLNGFNSLVRGHSVGSGEERRERDMIGEKTR